MTDRELLELADTAAGIERLEAEFFDNDFGDWWNPLTDDGDALRLAVKLDMHCVFPAPSRALILECGGDSYAATRRAIVLAAAKIVQIAMCGQED